MFVKQKQPIEKGNPNQSGKSDNGSEKNKDILDNIGTKNNGNMIPPRVKSPPSLLSTDLFIKGNLNTFFNINLFFFK